MNLKHICNKKIPDSLTWILLVAISIYQHYFDIYMYAATHWLRVPEAQTLMMVSAVTTLVFFLALWVTFAPLKNKWIRLELAFLIIFFHYLFHPTY